MGQKVSRGGENASGNTVTAFSTMSYACDPERFCVGERARNGTLLSSEHSLIWHFATLPVTLRRTA